MGLNLKTEFAPVGRNLLSIEVDSLGFCFEFKPNRQRTSSTLVATLCLSKENLDLAGKIYNCIKKVLSGEENAHVKLPETRLTDNTEFRIRSHGSCVDVIYSWDDHFSAHIATEDLKVIAENMRQFFKFQN